jgi:small subunit ribosomal protein S14
VPKASKIASHKKQQRQANNPVVVEQRKKLKKEKTVDAMFKLERTRNNSRTRTVNRCNNCKRPKGVYKYFNLCRLCLIKHAGLGIIPGLKLSSW